MALEPMTDAMNVVELVEWFEDVAAGRAGSRLLTLASGDPVARQSTLHSFYQGLAEHRSFGPVWPTVLPKGGLAPEFSTELFLPTPRFTWLGICASDEPAAEAAQLLDQLVALAQLTNAPAWVREASGGPFQATLGPQLFDGGGESADHAFAVLGGAVGGIPTELAVAVRLLDEIIETHPLLPEGGALQADAPRARARATVAAGWLQRLATHGPIALVVDEAHKAGPFLGELIDHVLTVNAPILVVLAGEPFAAGDAAVPYRGRAAIARRREEAVSNTSRLAGRFNTYAGQAVAAVSLPAGPIGDLTAALAAALPTGLFTVNHLRAAASVVEVNDMGDALDEMIGSDWVRRIAKDVFAFISDGRRAIAIEQARNTFTDDTLQTLKEVVATGVAGRAHDMEPLRTLIELGGARDKGDIEYAWRHARLLSAYGEIERAVQLVGSTARSSFERALVSSWKQSTTGERPAVDPGATTDPVALILHAASIARRDANGSSALMARALPMLQPHANDGFTNDLRARLAAARVFLGTGDLAGLDRALSTDLRGWLARRALEQIEELSKWRAFPGMVARSVDTMANLNLLATLRSTMPGSLALTYGLVARLELLERLGRLDTADDASAIAWEAGHLLSATVQRRPGVTWRAIHWLAWANQRRGDTDTALALLDQLLVEQRHVLPPDHAHILTTLQWKARCLLDADRVDEAHEELDHVKAQRERILESDHPDLLSTHHWHAEILAKLGEHAAAAAELADVVARRANLLAADDEDLLSSRHRYGSALANCGQFADALRQFNEVIARRAQMDIEDAPRLLAARHSRAVCLLISGRHAEALAELDQVLSHRANHMDATTPVLVDARSDRATCLVVLGRFEEALADLDIVVHQRLQRFAPEDARVILSRQQRVGCYLNLGRHAEALAEINGILQATNGIWATDDRMLTELRAVRAQLQPA